jgi:PKD repeat protein
MLRFLTLAAAIFFFSLNSTAQRATCAPDTVEYALRKGTQFDTISLQPFFTNAVYQYFEAPQMLNISGARFYGYKSDTAGGESMSIIVELRKATTDSLPGNNVLASDTVLIFVKDSMNIPFDSLFIDANWTSVTTDANYCIVVRSEFEATSTPDFSIYHNKLDGANSDGLQEFLSGVRQGVGWVKGDVYQPTGEPFDADFMLLPFVQYNLTSTFINDPECLFDELGETVNFFNESAIIADHRMYNKFAFYNTTNGQIWNYGDGSPQQNAIDPSHFYPTNGPFAATMTNKILTWNDNICQSSVTQIIKERPSQDFTYTANNLNVSFTNKTLGLFSEISYDFGDGNTSANEDPNHSYAKPGTYWVCQTMMTACGEIEQCKNVSVATNTTLNCGKDSVKYIAARGTEAKSMTLKNTSPKRLLGIGMPFDTPQSMIVHGFSFYANHNGLFRDSYPVTCRIYRRMPGGLPDTIALDSAKVRINKYDVDTLYSDTTRYTAIFGKALNLVKDQDYILTVEYDSNFPIQIVTTDWTANDGEGKFQALGKVNDTLWVSAASVGLFSPPGNAPFDAEPIFEPLVEYNFDANFDYDFDCILELPKTYNFQNYSSEIAGSRIYNKLVFDSTQVSAYAWDYGDSSGVINQVNGSHYFTGTGPFDVTHTITLIGWTTTCVSSQMLNVPVPPTGGWSSEKQTSEVVFYDESVNADEYWWTFSDGTFSTLASPTHYFTQLGTFEVCQYVSNVCGSDTICDSITINVLGIPDAELKNIQVYPNPAHDYLTISGFTASGNDLEFTLVDLSGRVVRNVQFANGVAERQWYVGDLARGTYTLRMKAGDYEGVKKFILD